MSFDEWRGSFDGRPTMFIKRLLALAGCRVDLHKIVRADDVKCFHTHPAWAVRVILRGGYIEETEAGELHVWRPFAIGIVRPSFCHRVTAVAAPSFSLWIRGPICADVDLRGDGWPQEKRGVQRARN